MEDGELSDSGSETEQHTKAGAAPSFNPVCLPRPSAPTPVEAFRKSQVPGLSSESEESDSDVEGEGFPKRKCYKPQDSRTNFKNPLLQSKHRGPSDLGFQNTEGKGASGKDVWNLDRSKAQQSQSKPKNVWGNVLAEQVLTQEIGSFAVEKDLSALSYRNVEAYQLPRHSNITYDDDLFGESGDDEESKETKEQKKPVEVEMESKSPDTEDKEAKDQEGLFEIETFGTIPEKKLPKLSVKDRLGSCKSDSDSDSGEDRRYHKSRPQSKRGEVDDFQKELVMYTLKRKRDKNKKKNVKERLGKKRETTGSETLPLDLIQVTETDSTEKIVAALTHNLKEPKVGLMTRVVDILGPRRAVDLMSETITIESTGGLMIKNGSRRRTPGGVFLFLLREDRHIRKEDLDKIFEEERELDKQRKRKILKAKRVQLAAVKRPQDVFSAIKSDNVPKAALETEASKTGELEMEDGELEDDDLDLETEIGIQLE